MEEYILLKDMPTIPAGTIFRTVDKVDLPEHVVRDYNEDNPWYSPSGAWCPTFMLSQIKRSPDWFEKICDWPKSIFELPVIKGFYVTNNSNIQFWNTSSLIGPEGAKEQCRNVFVTEKQAKSALAYAQLTQLAKAMNGDWEPDFSKGAFAFSVEYHYCLVISKRNVKALIVFKTQEMAEFSMKHHTQLWKDYWMID